MRRWWSFVVRQSNCPTFQIAVAGWLALEHRLEEASEIIRPMVAASLDDLPHDLGRLGNFVGVSAVAFPDARPRSGPAVDTAREPGLAAKSQRQALSEVRHPPRWPWVALTMCSGISTQPTQTSLSLLRLRASAGIQIFVAGTPLERATVLLDRNGPGDSGNWRVGWSSSPSRSPCVTASGMSGRDTRALLATVEGLEFRHQRPYVDRW